jgi:UTP--glucose-1-phosphate uridylyltransferase
MKNRKPHRQELEQKFQPFSTKMEKEGLGSFVVSAFRYYFDLLLEGHTGQISQADMEPVAPEEIAHAEKLTGTEEAGKKALAQSVVIKLNGGLGTSMGLSKAKTLLEVKDGLNFLDIIARQVLAFRRRLGVNLPLVFMNSFNTENDTLKALSSYQDLPVPGLPFSFVQHKFPKVLHDGLIPAKWPADPSLEWNPPGHGDLYAALVTSGALAKFLNEGIQYAFISNSDNLGAFIDQHILGYFAKNGFPFMMEVADRTLADSKGGHLARLKDGRLTLREIAQCPEDELETFQDVHIYRYFNTNNIWVNLRALKVLLAAKNNVMPLSMIRNPKTVDPKDDSSPMVYQLETAMGAAISVFDNATAIRVPRDRFAPVKKCQDLLALWSDAYVLTEEYQVVRNPKQRLGPPLLQLDSKYYKRIDQLKARFPHGAPSLLACRSLKVQGDVVFGKHIVIKGESAIANDSDRQVTIPDGSVIDTDMVFE